MHRVTSLVRKIHIYAGLQSLVAVVLFGLAGLGASWAHSPDFKPPESRTLLMKLDLPPGASIRRQADRIHETLAVPLSRAPQDWALNPEPDGRVRFEVRSLNSLTHVVLDPARRRAQAQQRPLSLAELAVDLHEVRLTRPLRQRDFRLQLWGLYIEFSVLALWTFIVSGLYLWLAIRPGRPLAVISFGSGCMALLISVWWMN